MDNVLIDQIAEWCERLDAVQTDYSFTTRAIEIRDEMRKIVDDYRADNPEPPEFADAEADHAAHGRTSGREKGDDDGQEYGHPDDRRRGIE